MNRWVQYGVCVIEKIQKREAYFDCTAAPGDNCAILSLAELPSVSLPASLARPRSRHAMVGVAGMHKSSGGWIRKRSASHQNRSQRSGVEEDPHPYVDLHRVNERNIMILGCAYRIAAGILLVVVRRSMASTRDVLAS